MADISKITLPNGTTYDIKDATARAEIAAITGGTSIVFIGVSSTAITDGGNETPTITGWTGPVAPGNLVFYTSKEFIYGTDNVWHEMGDLSGLGALAYKSSASGNVTPSGTVSQPTFTGASSDVTISATNSASGNYQPAGSISGGAFTGSSTTFTGSFTPSGSVSVSTASTTNKTAAVSPASSGTTTYTPAGSVTAPTISVDAAGSTSTIHNPTKVTVAKTLETAAPGATAPSNAITYYAVSSETLSLYQIGYTKGDSITTSDVTVKTGDATYTASAPTFSGTGVRLVTGNIAVPNTYSATFTGSAGDVSTSGTPNGSVGAISFTGTKVQLSGTTTASGSVSQPTFSGSATTVTVS